jgi:two-component system phosphate regulon response regulator PhoB
LLHRLRGAVSPSTPVMVLSGLRQESTIVKVLKSGADDYITKPFNPRELVARLQRRLGA